MAESVDLPELRRVVEHLTGSPDLGSWHSDEFGAPAASATRGIWRVQGDAWSVVLKLVGHHHDGHPNWLSGAEPDHWYYWRREVLAYQSGLVSSFAAGLGAPECLLIAEQSDSNVALWLEDVGALSAATDWPVTRYGPMARHLGGAQGEFAAGRPLPDQPWLSRAWLRSYLAQRDADMALLEDDAAWAPPLVERWLPREWARPLLDMRRHQEVFLRYLDHMPPTVCHLDLHPANIFATDDETVLIDWSFIGIGAVGEDAGNLVLDAVLDFHVPAEHIGDLYEVIRAGYVRGLQEAGWRGSAETVDVAMSATIAAKYAWIAPAMLRAALDDVGVMNKRPIDETFAAWGPAIPFLVQCADRARRAIKGL